MLLRFRFSNFRSFRGEQELSTIAGAVNGLTEIIRRPAGIKEGVLPVTAIYGANASGKTNLLRALRFMRDAVKDSHARWAPDEPIELQSFAGDPGVPSTFSVDLLLSGIRYQYGFTAATDGIASEWLYAYPSGKKQIWFIREKGKPISFSVKMPGDNRTIERLTRPNSLFLSAAAQNNHQSLSPIYRWFSRSLSFVLGRRPSNLERARRIYRNAELRKRIAALLSLADFGIADIDVQRVDLPQDAESVPNLLFAAAGGRVVKDVELTFRHRIGDSICRFSEGQESKGTMAFLCIIEPVLQAIDSGSMVCIDELDTSIHPLLALEIIKLFNDTQRNPGFGQFIFNTHDTNLLSADVLRRDEIWFTEKRQDGSSRLYPLTDFKPRKQENLENGYLQGRYGAIPYLNADRLFGEANETR